MKYYIKTYLTLAVTAAVATLAKENNVVRSSAFSDYVIPKDVFTPHVYAILFMAGLLLVASTPRPSFFKAIAQRFSPYILATYAGVGGGIFGWGVTLCTLEVISSGVSQWLHPFASGLLVFVITAAPLWIHAQAQSVHDKHSAWHIAPRPPWSRLTRLAGWGIAGITIWGSYDWFRVMS